MNINKQIQDSLIKASGIKDANLEFSSRPSFGDYTSNIALQSKNPRKKAEEILAKLNKDNSLKEIVEKIDIAGPGFINFHLSTKVLTNNLSQIIDHKNEYGYSTTNSGKKVIVEYSSPNIAKPFTIGHLRSTIIGDAIANLFEATGWKVYRDNHLGDWGTQFGKQIYAIKTWGNENDIEKSKNPVKELVKLYVKFHSEAEKDQSIEDKGREWFRRLEEGDKEARRLWQKCIDWSFKEFNKIYSQLGVKFTENDTKGYGESYFEDKMLPVVKELKDKNLLTEGDEGAKLIFFPQDKFPPLMILKKDGTTLYATRDLATDKFRKEKYTPDLIINEVGIEQSLYFKQLFDIEYMLKWYKKGQRIHVGHGHFRFKEGKMSTRKGNVIWLEDVLNQAVKRAEKFNKQPSYEVGIGAIKYNDLKRDYKQDILFDWNEVLNMEGNSGPYIQYTHARTQSVLNKSTKKPIGNNTINEEEFLLVRLLIKFPEIIELSQENFAPNIVCDYLYNLASTYNTYYNKVKIIGSDNEEAKLAVTFSVGQVIKNGLNLLGIAAPEKM